MCVRVCDTYIQNPDKSKFSIICFSFWNGQLQLSPKITNHL